MPVDVYTLLNSISRPVPLPLDRRTFEFTISISAIEVPAKQNILKLTQVLRSSSLLLNLPKTKSVVSSGNEASLVLLNDLYPPKDLDHVLEGFRASTNLVQHELKIGYDFWTAFDIIDCILPPGLDRITSFEAVGHIAHLNLTDAHMPFAEAIGQVILDVRCQTLYL